MADRQVRLPGLGWMLRQVRHDGWLAVAGCDFYFDHRVAAAYFSLAGGRLNEPGIHAHLGQILKEAGEEICLVNVGANVGEFALVTALQFPQVRVVAIEPIPGCCHAIRESARRMNLDSIEVIQAAAGSADGQATFAIDRNPHTSSLTAPSANPLDVITVNVITVDGSVKVDESSVVLLIDVEGHELEVLKGSRALIQDQRPTIYFEYNDASRQGFHIDELRHELGPDYLILRVNDDGHVDDDIDHAWNCVAIPQKK